MTSPAVTFAPAARLLRVAGGRRALQLALLFGGLIVLGLLCGGRAQASGVSADIAPAAKLSAEPRPQLPASVRKHVQKPVQKATQTATQKPARTAAQKPAQKPARTATRTTVQTTVEKAERNTGAVVHRVRETVDAVAERADARTPRTPLTDAVRATVRTTVAHVVEPVEELTGAVSRPLPGLPGVPGVGAEPPPPSAGAADPRPVTVPAPVVGETARHSTGQRSAGASGCGPVQFGDDSATGTGQPVAVARHTGVRPAAPSVPSRPNDAPVANTSLGDGGSTRHGDLHAAAFGSRVPVLLTPGATASGDVPPVLDRLREIPRFPG
ncbi:hypothetical protein ABZ930_37830 [Streptomyces sp. NPDC046716]|uniref:hypothetical protein n=1 Tax=Streptomyces sp. NPDC046716 TaxID=3157093 RepID=UPI0033DE0823